MLTKFHALRCASPGAGVVTGLVLLAYPGYGLIFHELSSEPVFATIFAVWAYLVGRTVTEPSVARFVLVGIGVALATLTRPGPFLSRTHRLGGFVGIREDGRLIAMAGERMKLPGFQTGQLIHQ